MPHFPSHFEKKIEINLEIRGCFECMVKKKLNLPLQMSNWTSIFRLVYPAFGLFLWRPFFQRKNKIHGRFRGIWGSICKQQPPPQPLAVPVSKPCSVQNLPMVQSSPVAAGLWVPSCSKQPYANPTPEYGKACAAAMLLPTSMLISCDKCQTDSSS